jgi:hypothetical protein
MKTVTRRIAKLEDQFGTAQRETPVLLAMSAAASELALDQDRCMEILRECGHLPTGPGFGIVYLYEAAIRRYPYWLARKNHRKSIGRLAGRSCTNRWRGCSRRRAPPVQ